MFGLFVTVERKLQKFEQIRSNLFHQLRSLHQTEKLNLGKTVSNVTYSCKFEKRIQERPKLYECKLGWGSLLSKLSLYKYIHHIQLGICSVYTTQFMI